MAAIFNNNQQMPDDEQLWNWNLLPLEREVKQRFETLFYHWNGSSAEMRIESDHWKTALDFGNVLFFESI